MNYDSDVSLYDETYQNRENNSLVKPLNVGSVDDKDDNIVLFYDHDERGTFSLS